MKGRTCSKLDGSTPELNLERACDLLEANLEVDGQTPLGEERVVAGVGTEATHARQRPTRPLELAQELHARGVSLQKGYICKHTWQCGRFRKRTS